MVTTLFSDDGTASVTAGGTTAPAQGTSESWTVTGSTLPSAVTGTSQCYISDPAVPTEVMLVTNTSGGTLTVTRGADGTTPAAHNTPFTVFCVVPAGVLAPLGLVGAAGGLASLDSSGHVPVAQLAAGQFAPETYGAKGNGVIVTDATISSSSNALACTTSTPFASGDVGKYVVIPGAGASGAALFTTISGFTDSGHVTLATTAGTSVTGAGMIFGTDDTAAIQAAVNAAVTYAQLGNGREGVVQFRDAVYCIAGAPVKGSPTFGDAQITLPVISPTAGVKVQLTLKGTSSAVPLHWTQPRIIQAGTCLAAMRADGSLDLTNGPSTVIGGPVNGYGAGSGLFSNMCLTVDGLTILWPLTPGGYCGLDLYGLGQARVKDYAYMPMAVVPASTPWPQISAVVGAQQPTYNYGLRMPTETNNAVSDIEYYVCYAAQVGLVASEHTTFHSLTTIYCAFGLLMANGGAGGNPQHGLSGLYWTCENTTVPIGALTSGFFAQGVASPFRVALLSLETFASVVVQDSGNLLTGEVWFETLSVQNHYYNGLGGAGGGVATGAAGLRLLAAGNLSGPVASPQAPPASGSAWYNLYYRDAWITLSATTSISAVSVDSTAQLLAAGAKQAVLVPSGHSYTPTYTGTLSHTVTLL